MFAATRLCFVNRYGFSKLLDSRRMKILFVVDPTERVDESGYVRISLDHALGQSHRFVKISFSGYRIKPGEVVGGNDCIRILLESLTIILDCSVVILSLVLEDSDQRVGRSVFRTQSNDLLILGNGTIFLL